MKKSTKLITTAIALLLVISAMVIGIYAATSGTASISASVSWEAEAGIQFTIQGGVILDKAHYEANGNSLPADDEIDQVYCVDNAPQISSIEVNTTTTNAQASGMSRTLNAEFCDDTDDGVNNPRSIIYWYCISNNTLDEDYNPTVPYTVTITKIPKTTAAVKVQYALGTVDSVSASASDYSDTVPTAMFDHDSPPPPIIAIKLTLINPDQSLSSFDAGISFKFEKK